MSVHVYAVCMRHVCRYPRKWVRASSDPLLLVLYVAVNEYLVLGTSLRLS